VPGIAAAATRTRHDPAVALWIVAAVCWAGTAWLVVAGADGLGHHGVALERATWPWPLRLGAFLAVWLVMIGAMMLPTVVPMMRLFVAVSARAPDPVAARAAFLAGYLAVWAVFAGLALLGDIGLEALVAGWAWLAARHDLVLGAALVLAGAFQFSALKNACLTACRNPVGFLWQHYRRGAAGSWRLGLRHGMSCLGCCWALMLLMFATGVGSLVWMVGLTAVMVIEKTARRGAGLVVPVGVALLTAGAAVLISALLGGPS
jgi:predicted metal-binding membrane protein